MWVSKLAQPSRDQLTYRVLYVYMCTMLVTLQITANLNKLALLKNDSSPY